MPVTEELMARVLAVSLTTGGYIDLTAEDGFDYLDGKRDTYGARELVAVAMSLARALNEEQEATDGDV